MLMLVLRKTVSKDVHLRGSFNSTTRQQKWRCSLLLLASYSSDPNSEQQREENVKWEVLILIMHY